MSFLVSFKAAVADIESKRRTISAKRVGNDTVFEYEELGWFVRLEGSHESLHVGNEKPDLSIGQMIHVTMRGE